MAWDDVQTAEDCITYAEWNAMVAYVKCPEKSEVTFIMYDNCSAETGQVFKFDINGIISEAYGGADTGDKLHIFANSYDLCPVLEMEGNSGVTIKIKDSGGRFEVSTCTDEVLFEIDSGTDMHFDFHCLDAHNFVLELRTSDPSAPTCTGQIWFRTDLV